MCFGALSARREWPGKRSTSLNPRVETGLAQSSVILDYLEFVVVDLKRRLDLVTKGEVAWVCVGLGGVEAIHHIRLADSVFQIDKPE